MSEKPREYAMREDEIRMRLEIIAGLRFGRRLAKDIQREEGVGMVTHISNLDRIGEERACADIARLLSLRAATGKGASDE
jgi:hypothetical protein